MKALFRFTVALFVVMLSLSGIVYVQTPQLGTPVVVENVVELSSKTARVGEAVEFKVVEAVTVSGRVMIPEGATVWGKITIASHKSLLKAGKLEFSIDRVKGSSGKYIQLSGSSALAGGHSLGVLGGEVTVPAGTKFTATIGEATSFGTTDSSRNSSGTADVSAPSKPSVERTSATPKKSETATPAKDVSATAKPQATEKPQQLYSTKKTNVSGQWKDQLKTQLQTMFELTKQATFEMNQVTKAGVILAVRKENIQAEPVHNFGSFANKVYNGEVTAPGGIGGFFSRSNTRMLKIGERVYVTDIRIKDDIVQLWLLTVEMYDMQVKGNTKPTRLRAVLDFHFDKAELPMMSAEKVRQAFRMIVQ